MSDMNKEQNGKQNINNSSEGFLSSNNEPNEKNNQFEGSGNLNKNSEDFSDSNNQSKSFENVMRKFKRDCAKSGIMGEIRRREAYVKPSVERKIKSENARRRRWK